MKALLSTAQLRSVEQDCFKSVDSYCVMERAAAAVARIAAQMLPSGGPVMVFAGAGNNGGDALLAACYLRSSGLGVKVWMPLGEPQAGTDAAKAWAAYQASGGTVSVWPPDGPAPVGLCIDGLFGIGLSRDLDGPAASAVAQINSSTGPVLAIDVPSGLDADLGIVRGCAVRATTTISFFAGKPGLYTGWGPAYAGRVRIAELGAADLLSRQAAGLLIEDATACARLRRSAVAHKGSGGTLAVFGGAVGMTGALALATRAAVAHGAGKVLALSLDPSALAFDPLAPEVMWRKIGSLDQAAMPAEATAIAIGVGLGRLAEGEPARLAAGEFPADSARC